MTSEKEINKDFSQHTLNSFFGEGTVMKGTLKFKGKLRFDGKLEGEIHTTDTLLIGLRGDIKAKIKTGTLLNLGSVEGDISAEKGISIYSSGAINGNIRSPLLKIDPGARFNGQCEMTPEAPVAKNAPLLAGLKEFETTSQKSFDTPPKEEKKGESVAGGRGWLAALIFLLAIGLVGVLAGNEGYLGKGISRELHTLFHSENSEELLKEGLAFKNRGEKEPALLKLREAASRSSKDPLVPLILARAFVELGEDDEGLDQYKKVLALAPENREAADEYLRILIRRDLTDEAIKELNRRVGRTPGELKLHLELVALYKKSGADERVLEEHRRILSFVPDHEESLWAVTKSFLEKKDYVKSAELLEKLKEVKGNDPAVFATLGALYFRMGQEGRSTEEYNYLEQLDNDHIEVENNEGFRKVNQNIPDDALRIFDSVLAKDKNNIRALFGRVAAYTRKGWFTKAIQESEALVKLHSDVAPAQNRLAWLYGRKQINLEKAIELSKETLQRNPDSPEYLDTLSELYFKNGNIEMAIELINRAIKLSPGSVYYKRQLQKFEKKISAADS